MRFFTLTLLGGQPVAVRANTVKQVCRIPSVENTPELTRVFCDDGGIHGRTWDVKESVDEVVALCQGARP